MPRNPFRALKHYALVLIVVTAPAFGDPVDKLEAAIAELEVETGGRIGVVLRDAVTGWIWQYRGAERFPMNSTFKPLLCGAALAGADAGTLSILDRIAIEPAAIVDHAPVTNSKVGGEMSVAELCAATLDLSDNTAANLLIIRLGGPGAVTAFVRDLGDGITRLDRMEPELNLFTPGDPRDTTTPEAIIATLNVLLLGDVLSSVSREQLLDWMSPGTATSRLIRPHVPPGWRIADKSGGARDGARSIVALIEPPEVPPFLVAIYIAEAKANWPTRNAAVSRIGADVIEVIRQRLDGQVSE